MTKHVVVSISTNIVTVMAYTLPEATVTMGSGQTWTFRRGIKGKLHLMASGVAQPSRHPEYKPARDAARRALIGL